MRNLPRFQPPRRGPGAAACRPFAELSCASAVRLSDRHAPWPVVRPDETDCGKDDRRGLGEHHGLHGLEDADAAGRPTDRARELTSIPAPKHLKRPDRERDRAFFDAHDRITAAYASRRGSAASRALDGAPKSA